MIYQVIVTNREIPPRDYGGAERICFFLSQIIYDEIGDNKIIVASNLEQLKSKVLDLDIRVFDTFICHSDWITVELLKIVNCQIYHYSHFPYAEYASELMAKKQIKPRNFGGGINSLRTYRYIYRYIKQIIRLRNRDNVIICCMSKRIQKNFILAKIQNLQYWPNPIEIPRQKSYEVNNARLILVLGKVEKRKQQALIQRRCRNINLRFVGPPDDPSFNYDDARYLGVLGQSDLEEIFKKTKLLVLASDGEAQAQVLFEALGRGIKIACTKHASWDFHVSECVKIFDDVVDLCEYINIDPPFNNKARPFCADLVSDFSSPHAYASKYLRHLRK